MRAIEKMEDLMRHNCSRRDAQGNAHTLAEDIRMSSLDALLPDVEPCSKRCCEMISRNTQPYELISCGVLYSVDFVCMCVKPQMCLHVCHQMCSFRSFTSARLILLVSLARFSRVETGILIYRAFLFEH